MKSLKQMLLLIIIFLLLAPEESNASCILCVPNGSGGLSCGTVEGKKCSDIVLGVSDVCRDLFSISPGNIGICTLFPQNINKPNIQGPVGLQVNSFSGGLYYERADLTIPCQGPSINLRFYYNSSSTSLDFGYGSGWSMTYSMLYRRSGSSIILRREDGRKDIFTFNGSGYTPPVGIFDSLVQYLPNKFRLSTKSGIRYFFDDTTHKRLTKISDPNNNQLNISYIDSLATAITDPCGRSVLLNYTNGHLTDITDNNTTPARHITLTNDLFGNPITVADPLGNTLNYEYDAYRNIVKVTDQSANQFNVSYKNFLNVSSIKSPLNSINIDYDTVQKKTTVTELVSGNLQSSSFKFDSLGNISEKINNCCGYHELFSYDAQKNIIAKTDANNNVYSYNYDNRGNILQASDPLGGISTFTYEPVFNRITSITDKRLNTTQYAYDAAGNLTQISLPLFIFKNMTYNGSGKPTSYTDGRGNTTTYQYNSCGDLTLVTFPGGATNIYTYDNVGRKKTFTDGNSHVTSYNYDLLNRMTSKVDALGFPSTFTYDPKNNLLSSTDIFGITTSYTYDALNRRKTITNPTGTSTFNYDERGNMLSKINNNGFVTNFNYNTKNLLTNIDDPEGYYMTFEYDFNGNLISEIDFNGNTTNYTYDQLNRIKKKSKVNFMSQKIEYTFDAENNVTSIKDPKNQTTNYTYDALNRMINVTYANGTSKTFAYDAANNLTSKTNQNGQTATFTYDSRNRLTNKNYPGSNNDNYSYDNEFNITQANNSNANITFTYDNTDRIKTETMNGKTTDRSYNIPARKRTITYPGGRSIEEVYDNNLRLAFVREGANIASFTYDAGDRLLSRSYSNGVVSNYIYNNNDWITSLIHKKGSNTIASFNYDYDSEGNILSEKKNHHLTNSEKYTYMEDYKLTEFKVGTIVGNDIPSPLTQIQYSYDQAGNRISIQNVIKTTYEVNSVNQYTSILNPPFTPTYDLNGNTLSDPSNSYTSYDFKNRLLTVNGIGGVSAEYKYDALGRRIQKIISPGSNTLNYYYDGKVIIEERNSSDEVQATYVYGENIDEILNMKRGSTNYYYHQNSLGSIVAVSSSSGLASERYEYDAFGKPTIYDGVYTVRTATAIGNTYMFTGREYDAETGNYHYRARFYIPGWGRFGQQDPIGNWGDEFNWGNGYTYVGNNPVNITDPLGLTIKMLTASREATTDARNVSTGTIKASRDQNNDTREVADRTNTSETNRTNTSETIRTTLKP